MTNLSENFRKNVQPIFVINLLDKFGQSSTKDWIGKLMQFRKNNHTNIRGKVQSLSREITRLLIKKFLPLTFSYNSRKNREEYQKNSPMFLQSSRIFKGNCLISDNFIHINTICNLWWYDTFTSKSWLAIF